MTNEKLKINYKIQPAPIHNLRTVKGAINSVRLIRPQVQQKYPEHIF